MVTNGTPHSKDALLTVADVATLLKVSENTVRNMVSGGRIPHARIGALIRFDPADLRRWIEERKEKVA